MTIDHKRTNQAPPPASQAVPRRLRLAYPELAVLFPLLRSAQLRGESWQLVVDAYIEMASTRLLDRLAMELADLFLIGLTDDHFNAFCQSIGMSAAVADASGQTVSGFVATLQEQILGERLARFAQG